MVGAKSDRSVSFSNLLRPRSMNRPVRWAFDGLDDINNPREQSESLRGKYAALLPLIPPGGNYLFLTKARGCKTPLFEPRSKYWSFLYKLHPDQISLTIPATRISNNGPFHWDNRRLRTRELSRLQSFPDFAVRVEDANGQRHIGNAVPPLVAAELFRVLAKILDIELDAQRLKGLERLLAPSARFARLNSFFSFGKPAD